MARRLSLFDDGRIVYQVEILNRRGGEEEEECDKPRAIEDDSFCHIEPIWHRRSDVDGLYLFLNHLQIQLNYYVQLADIAFFFNLARR